MPTGTRFFLLFALQLLTSSRRHGILIMKGVSLHWSIGHSLFCEHREGSFFFVNLTTGSHPAILMMEGDPSVLNFFFYPLAHTRRFFFLKFSEEHLTFRNRRDILNIVQQMAKFHLFF